jgi:hypothetical protein
MLGDEVDLGLAMAAKFRLAENPLDKFRVSCAQRESVFLRSSP